MHVLVTGGAGFIGSHLVERALAAGSRVRVLDNLSTGKRSNLPADSRVEFIEGDIRDPRTVREVVQGVDAIAHLAAVASVQASVDDPLGTHASNFDGTLNLLDAARHANVRRFVYASSAAVYGNTEQLPVEEAFTPRPLTPYASDKLAGEHYLEFYSGRYGMDAVAFRFFNIYGPRQDPSSPYSGVISIMADRLARRAPMTIFGDGQQSRDFVYVGDLARILWRAVTGPHKSFQVMNVGRGQSASLLEVLDAFESVAGTPLERIHAEPRHGDIRHSCAAVTRLKDAFGESTPTALNEGLGALWKSLSK
jgi:UDP-glucose 4-epimerase